MTDHRPAKGAIITTQVSESDADNVAVRILSVGVGVVDLGRVAGQAMRRQ